MKTILNFNNLVLTLTNKCKINKGKLKDSIFQFVYMSENTYFY